jgi:hypothetical protein
MKRFGSFVTLYQELQTSPDPVCLNDTNDGSDRVEKLRVRVVDILPLSYGKEAAVTVESGLNSLDRSGAPGRNGNGHPRIHDSISQGKYREGKSLTHIV